MFKYALHYVLNVYLTWIYLKYVDNTTKEMGFVSGTHWFWLLQ